MAAERIEYENLSKDEQIFIDSFEERLSENGLFEILEVRKKDRWGKNLYCIRFKPNNYRLKSIEARKDVPQVKICYDGKKVKGTDFENALKTTGEVIKTSASSITFQDESFVSSMINVLSEDTCPIPAARSSSQGFEGLNLPVVDTEEAHELGTSYSWKDVLAIIQEPTSELYKSLSKGGVYLQRSSDGAARYVGSAYGEGGIIDRWKSHLSKGGDAKFLSWYILENGYKAIEFTVLEFSENEDAINLETKWKKILGTKTGLYNGLQLNNN